MSFFGKGKLASSSAGQSHSLAIVPPIYPSSHGVERDGLLVTLLRRLLHRPSLSPVTNHAVPTNFDHRDSRLAEAELIEYLSSDESPELWCLEVSPCASAKGMVRISICDTSGVMGRTSGQVNQGLLLQQLQGWDGLVPIEYSKLSESLSAGRPRTLVVRGSRSELRHRGIVA